MSCEKGERNSGETDPTVMVNAKGEGQINKSLLLQKIQIEQRAAFDSQSSAALSPTNRVITS